MNKIKLIAGGLFLAFIAYSVLTDDSGSDDYGTAGYQGGEPDYYGIMDRMVVVAEYFSDGLAQSAAAQGVAATDEEPLLADPETMATFTDVFEQAINDQPALYSAPMGVNLLDDGSFRGFEDLDGDGEKGMTEKGLWTLEIDEANERLVLTTEGSQRYGFSGIGTGLIAGAILGNMMGRQRASGVNPGRFSSANVSTRSASQVRSARSSARTGGARVGK